MSVPCFEVKRFLQTLFTILLVFVATPAIAEVSVSFSPGLSLLLDQDVKVREFNSNGQETSRKFPSHASSALGPLISTKFTYFMHKNFGIETEIFYSRTAIDMNVTGTRFTQTEIAQNRITFIPSIVGRTIINSQKNISAYAGLGYGWIYSDVTEIGKEWGLGGQMYLGLNLPVNARYSVFFESKYSWSPDVGSENTSPGEQLKLSGNGSNNLAKRVFGPHSDTQILGFIVGFRFKTL